MQYCLKKGYHDMILKIIALVILTAFYTFYFMKIIIQKRQSIRTAQLGVGNKAKKVLFIERTLSLANILAPVISVCSIFIVKKYPAVPVRIAGIAVGITAVVIFATATITMKSSWRVGIPEEKTTLITSGIYSWSRNPAYVGFDLLYLSVCLMFFNIPLMIISIWAAVMLHLQIIQEEIHLHNMYGPEYDEYKAHTMRYIGRR